MSSAKRLFLLRHAMAASDFSGVDKERPLTPQGKEDAKILGKAMLKHAYVPDVILCSSALRTRQTLESLNNHLGVDNIDLRDTLYSGSTGDYLYEVQQTKDDYDNILIIAHNPSISELVRLLGAQGQESILSRLHDGYAPATLSVIECECKQWSDIQPAENTLSDYLAPIDYNAPARPTRWM